MLSNKIVMFHLKAKKYIIDILIKFKMINLTINEKTN